MAIKYDEIVFDNVFELFMYRQYEKSLCNKKDDKHPAAGKVHKQPETMNKKMVPKKYKYNYDLWSRKDIKGIYTDYVRHINKRKGKRVKINFYEKMSGKYKRTRNACRSMISKIYLNQKILNNLIKETNLIRKHDNVYTKKEITDNKMPDLKPVAQRSMSAVTALLKHSIDTGNPVDIESLSSVAMSTTGQWTTHEWGQFIFSVFENNESISNYFETNKVFKVIIDDDRNRVLVPR